MSLDDRDWWREDRKRKEKLYGGDFSLHSKPIKNTNHKNALKSTSSNTTNYSLLNMPLNTISVLFFVGIIAYGIYLRVNIIVVIILASLAATVPEIKRVPERDRLATIIKVILFSFFVGIILNYSMPYITFLIKK